MSPYAGTTRDVLEVSLDIGGYPVVLCDTAGLRMSTDPIENEGLKLAKETASNADLVIIVLDASNVQTDRLFQHSVEQIAADECKRLGVSLGELASSI